MYDVAAEGVTFAAVLVPSGAVSVVEFHVIPEVVSHPSNWEAFVPNE